MRTRSSQPSALRRWLRFNFVGFMGVGVQLAVLQTLVLETSIDYRWATLIAVELTVVHNFLWHLRYTWRERRLRSARLILRRFVEFNLTNGAISLAGSWTLMTLLVGRARLPVIIANLISIVACSLLNFLLAEVLVFRKVSTVRKRRRSNYTRPDACCKRLSVQSSSFSLPSTCTER